MRPTIYLSLSLLLSPLSVLAAPRIASDTTSNILRRSPIPMKPLARGISPAHILARSPHSDDDDAEVCASDEKHCGDKCFPTSYTCCPKDVSGGCPAGEQCQKDDGRYGCCPEGEECHWDNDDDDDDDDDNNVFDDIKDFGHDIGDSIKDVGEDIKDGWNDFWNGDEDAGANLRPEMITIGVLASVAVVMGVL